MTQIQSESPSANPSHTATETNNEAAILTPASLTRHAPQGSNNWRDFLPPARNSDSGCVPRLGTENAPTTWPEFLLRGETLPAEPNTARMYRDNQARVRAELKRRDIAALVLYDPLNIRYVSGTRNMSVWTLHNAARYCFLAADGPCVMFDFHNCEHLSDGLDTVQEVRHALAWFYFEAGTQAPARAKTWAAQITDLLQEYGGGNKRIAFDHLDPLGCHALEALGAEIEEGQAVVEYCRARKSADEMAAIRRAVQVCEAGVAALQDAITPGCHRKSGLVTPARSQYRQRRRVG